MKKIIAAIALFLLNFLALAETKTVTTNSEIQKIIVQIPVIDKDFGYKNIGERMQNIGMKIEFVQIDLIGKEDAEPPYYKAGDLLIRIRGNEPNKVIKAICPIAGSPEYIKRGKKYIPNNRTAYWLMHNRCDFQG